MHPKPDLLDPDSLEQVICVVLEVRSPFAESHKIKRLERKDGKARNHADSGDDRRGADRLDSSVSIRADGYVNHDLPTPGSAGTRVAEAWVLVLRASRLSWD